MHKESINNLMSLKGYVSFTTVYPLSVFVTLEYFVISSLTRLESVQHFAAPEITRKVRIPGQS